uniref:Uncharacterized protein n=1 Tax=Ananas comosus var. bracteatus TaxID=296719 RepID=A0A6V7PLA4_ANACO|nr:unnamed protein product [Ananas comosus var. bracteatus]
MVLSPNPRRDPQAMILGTTGDGKAAFKDAPCDLAPAGAYSVSQQRPNEIYLELGKGVKAATHLCNHGYEGCSNFKKVTWANTLTRTAYFRQDNPLQISRSFTAPTKSQAADNFGPENKPRPDRQDWKKRPPSTSFKRTYRDVLLSPGRCYRCLGRDHWVAHCHDPIRCTKSFKSGHRAKHCMQHLLMEIYRAMRVGLAYLSVFVPLSDDFWARQNRRRNAILVDVVPPTNLGHFPQDTIANGLASPFGRYTTDFHIARYRERDFVVFLSEWVPCDDLIHRDILSLGDFDCATFPGIHTVPHGGRHSPTKPGFLLLVFRTSAGPLEPWRLSSAVSAGSSDRMTPAPASSTFLATGAW